MEISRLQYSKVTSQLRHRRLIKLPLLFFIFLILAPSSWYLYAALQNPLPVISAIPQVITIEPKKPLVIPWPRIGQAAVGSLEEGLINSSSTNLEAVPIASTAKIITSLAVMRVKPFSSGTNGQMITLSDADVAYYEQYRALGGSTVLVSAGEQISEYQALQAMLLPSANNMADSIAVWAFGSTDAYVTYANNMLKEFGLTKTVISDPSGWSPKTKSTAAELIILGQKLLQQPVLNSIVGQQQADIPIANTIKNTNTLLASGGIGIKTGHTDDAGGCLVYAQKKIIDPTHTTTIITAVLSAPTSSEAITSTTLLIDAVSNNFGARVLVSNNAEVGLYKTAWGTTSKIVTTAPLIAYGWMDSKYTLNISPKVLYAPVMAGTLVGTIATTKSQSIMLKLKSTLTKPSLWWRLQHFL